LGVPDFALVYADGVADLAIVDDDVLADDGLQTAVLLSLFCDAPARDGDQIPDGTDDPRGFWGDEFAAVDGDIFGSRLWLLDRAKVRTDQPPESNGVGRAQMAREALQWMIDDGVTDRVEAEDVIVDGVPCLQISIYRPTTEPAIFTFPHVWLAEEARA
jgi:phage gp46-like protein